MCVNSTYTDMTEELMDKTIEDLDGANLAATKIQARFRGYQVRKKLQEEREREDPIIKVNKKEANSERIIRDSSNRKDSNVEDTRMEDKRKMANESLEDKSATKIQAGVRGYLVRKRQQAEQAAATKIQAGFRGFRTRKLLKQTGQ